MPSMVLGDRRSSDFAMFDRWRREVTKLLDEFNAYNPLYRPFHENECAGVSLLSSAAARAGYTPVAESNSWKRDVTNRRMLAANRGRSDLWMIADGKAYSFEFKMSWIDSDAGQLAYCMDLAWDNISCISYTEYDRSYAGLIAPVTTVSAFDHHRSFDPGGYKFYVVQDRYVAVFFYFGRWG